VHVTHSSPITIDAISSVFCAIRPNIGLATTVRGGHLELDHGWNSAQSNTDGCNCYVKPGWSGRTPEASLACAGVSGSNGLFLMIFQDAVKLLHQVGKFLGVFFLNDSVGEILPGFPGVSGQINLPVQNEILKSPQGRNVADRPFLQFEDAIATATPNTVQY
jgi:hypothetical protein